MKYGLKFGTRFGDKKRVSIKFDEPTLTKQAHKDECDVNNILNKYMKTGQITHVRQGGMYADLSDVGTYQESLNVVLRAQEAFENLPAKLRERFANDPAQLISFLGDDANRDEAIKLGLVNAPESPTIVDGDKMAIEAAKKTAVEPDGGKAQ